MHSTAQGSWLSHLLELRTRLLRCLLAILLSFLGLWPFAKSLYNWLAQPLLAKLPQGASMIATAVTTPFFVPLKLTLLAAVVLVLPYVLYQLWAFIAPGLYAHEKRQIFPLVLASTLLFLLGGAFAYGLVLPVVFGFMVHAAPAGVAVMTDIEQYLDFVLSLFLAFGVAFQVPVVVVVLARLGVVSLASFKACRSYVIVGVFVVAAIVTPPDVVSQIMLAIPLYLLYEIGVLVAGWISPPDHARSSE